MNCGVLGRPTGFLKILELLLAVISLALIRSYYLVFSTYRNDFDRNLTAYIAIGGMILITFPLLVNHIIGGGFEKTLLEVMYNIVGVVAMFTAGIMAILTYEKGHKGNETVNAGLAMGSLCIINGVIYLVDTFFAVRNRK